MHLGSLPHKMRGRVLEVTGVEDSAVGQEIVLYFIPADEDGAPIEVSRRAGLPAGDRYEFVLDLEHVPPGAYFIEARDAPYEGRPILSVDRHGRAYSVRIEPLKSKTYA